MTTTLDIVDSAVKIGLGALISGFTTYVVTKHNHKRDDKKQKILRQKELVEQVAEQIEIVTHEFLKYWALILEWTRYKKTEREMPRHRIEELENSEAELFHSFKELSNAESKLMLLGFNDCQKMLRDYGEDIRKFRRTFFISDQMFQPDQIESMKVDILTHRETLFSSLSEVYNNKIV